ncbi:hypothetical protein AGMMS49593_01710 [Endomicrobiia bacterium]|nr:hypothetical protein AGMMS49593_01710 [Endomicrobiia bacterium]
MRLYAEALEAYAGAYDKLALILDRGKSKNWRFISRSDNDDHVEISTEDCRVHSEYTLGQVREIRGGELSTRNAIRGVTKVVLHFPIPNPNVSQLDPRNCVVCMELCKNPRECPRCHQQACYDCLVAWLNANNICPHCRANVEQMQILDL